MSAIGKLDAVGLERGRDFPSGSVDFTQRRRHIFKFKHS